MILPVLVLILVAVALTGRGDIGLVLAAAVIMVWLLSTNPRWG